MFDLNTMIKQIFEMNTTGRIEAVFDDEINSTIRNNGISNVADNI